MPCKKMKKIFFTKKKKKYSLKSNRYGLDFQVKNENSTRAETNQHPPRRIARMRVQESKNEKGRRDDTYVDTFVQQSSHRRTLLITHSARTSRSTPCRASWHPPTRPRTTIAPAIARGSVELSLHPQPRRSSPRIYGIPTQRERRHFSFQRFNVSHGRRLLFFLILPENESIYLCPRLNKKRNLAMRNVDAVECKVG